MKFDVDDALLALLLIGVMVFIGMVAYTMTPNRCGDGQVWVHTDKIRGCVPVAEAVNLK